VTTVGAKQGREQAELATPALSDDLRARTLERFENHRRVWGGNRALRALNAALYQRVAAELPVREVGRRVELGSGPGFAREFIPDIELTDLVRAPWHDREASAESLPFDDGSVGALVLFDVLHHLPSPRRFFEEAVRVLPRGGRIVMCEPHISPISYPVYKFLHDEPLDLGADPLALYAGGDARDPFDANQAIPTLLFGRRRAAFEAAFPALSIQRVQYMSGFSCPASGGFSHGPFLPWPIWSLWHRMDTMLPSALMRWMAFRMLVVLERA
jgi:SAM-dependent methyltransferase